MTKQEEVDRDLRAKIDELEDYIRYLKAGVEKDGSTTAVSSSD